MRKAVALLIHISKDTKVAEVRVGAIKTLSRLIENDPDLQYMAAISERLIQELSNHLSSSDEGMQEAVLYLYAALGASHEDVRKRIIDAHVVTHILHILQTSSTASEYPMTTKVSISRKSISSMISKLLS